MLTSQALMDQFAIDKKYTLSKRLKPLKQALGIHQLHEKVTTHGTSQWVIKPEYETLVLEFLETGQLPDPPRKPSAAETQPPIQTLKPKISLTPNPTPLTNLTTATPHEIIEGEFIDQDHQDTNLLAQLNQSSQAIQTTHHQFQTQQQQYRVIQRRALARQALVHADEDFADYQILYQGRFNQHLSKQLGNDSGESDSPPDSKPLSA